MTVAKLRILCAILAFLLIGALVLLWLSQRAVRDKELRPAFGPQHAAIIDRAYRLSAARNRLPVERIREQDYPIVVGLPEKNCVQLTPPLTSVGGHEIYCFRVADGALVEQHQIGE